MAIDYIALKSELQTDPQGFGYAAPLAAGNDSQLAALVNQIHGPINILANPGVPSAPELQRLGVARVSMGSGPMRATMALTRRIAKELIETGTYRTFTDDTIPYAEANKLFVKQSDGVFIDKLQFE